MNRGGATLALCSLVLVLGCTKAAPGTGQEASAGAEPIRVFAASSLGPWAKAVGQAYQADTGRTVQVELSASRIACQKVAEQGKKADLVLSADYELLEELLVPNHAEFSMRIGGHALVLAYSKAAFPEGLSPDTWWKVLSESSTELGYADPIQAPVGYRTLLALKLLESDGGEQAKAAEAIRTSMKAENRRPNVGHLIAPLQAGQFGAAFVYQSDAEKKGVSFVRLGSRYDFSDADLAEHYASATLKVGQGENARTRQGAPAVFGLTIPKQADASAATDFTRYLLGPKGRREAETYAIHLFAPGTSKGVGKVPEGLSTL